LTDTITSEQMRDKLLDLSHVRETLARTEPLSEIRFSLQGSKSEIAQFKLGDTWNENIKDVEGTEPVNVAVSVGGSEYNITKDALLEATSLIGIRKEYMSKSPASLMEPHLNYWYSNTDKELKLLVANGTVVALTKGTISPFSNLRLLDLCLQGFANKYGSQNVLVDYKFVHDLRRTAVRLILPEYERQIAGRDGDIWSVGLQLRNSLAAESPLALNGYLFRWWCTNGAVSTHNESGNYSRRTGGQSDSVYEWAEAAVEEILGGLEHEFDAIDELANSPVPNRTENDEADIAEALTDVFGTYRVPLTARESIIHEATNTVDPTMYGVMQAITQAANDPRLSEPLREQLMEIGGHLPADNSTRCEACRRILPE
jgi:hypothetical protein